MQCARKERKDEGMMEEQILIVVLALPLCSKPRFLARKRKSWVCVCVSVVSNTHLDVVWSMKYGIHGDTVGNLQPLLLSFMSE